MDEIRTTAILGASGQMGRLYARRCREAGLEVRELGRPYDEASLRDGIRGAEQVLLSVPAWALEDLLQKLVPLMAPGQILSDNTSVKVLPMRLMREHWQGPVVGTHPLFGPEPPPELQRVAVTPGPSQEDAAAGRAVDVWQRRLGFTPFLTTAEEHDEAMAHIQGLNFVTSVAYLATLSQREDMLPFLTPSFHRRLEAARKMLTEDAQLFATLFETNPYGQDAVRRYRNFLHVAAGGDVDLLVQQAQWWWRGDDD
jgi:prephenate dehydrogenase